MGVAASLLAQLSAGAFDNAPVSVQGFTPLALPGTTNGVFLSGNAAAEVGTGILGGERVIVLAFRGSDDRQDWINDLRDINADYATFAPLVAALDAYAAATFQTVVVTGHSLGAALAQVFMSQHPAGGAVTYEAVAFASPGALIAPAIDPRITTYNVIDDPVVFLGDNRKDIGDLVASNPLVARAFADKLTAVTPLTTSDVLDSIPFLTANYVTRGDIVLMDPGGRDKLTLQTLLTNADFNEHSLTTYLPLVGLFNDPANQGAAPTATAAAAATVGTAARGILRVDFSDIERNADALRLDKGFATASYLSELVQKAGQATTPALIVASLLEGAIPTSARLDSLTAFSAEQFQSYQRLGVQDARLGPYEALGRAFAETSGFKAKYASGDDATYVNVAYLSIFKTNATSAQVTHFLEQDAYLEKLYLTAGLSAADSALAARGAVVGQMIGFATLPADSALNKAATAFLIDASDGQVQYGVPLAGIGSTIAADWGV